MDVFVEGITGTVTMRPEKLWLGYGVAVELEVLRPRGGKPYRMALTLNPGKLSESWDYYPPSAQVKKVGGVDRWSPIYLSSWRGGEWDTLVRDVVGKITPALLHYLATDYPLDTARLRLRELIQVRDNLTSNITYTQEKLEENRKNMESLYDEFPTLAEETPSRATMTGRYAEGTSVDVGRSRDEIESTLRRFGAERFGYMTDTASIPPKARVAFTVRGRSVSLVIHFPDRDQFRFHSRGERTEDQIESLWEKECRRVWRTLALGIKAKLAMIEDGITTFEREFYADIMLPSGSTVYDVTAEQVDEVIRSAPISRSAEAALLSSRLHAIESGEVA